MTISTTLVSSSIALRFDRMVADTPPAHRVVWHYQAAQALEVATKPSMVSSEPGRLIAQGSTHRLTMVTLLQRYVKQARYVSAVETLLRVTSAAGVEGLEMEGLSKVRTRSSKI